VKCLASSSATFAQSRKYSTGNRSPLTSKSAKRAMISHARSMAYCSMLASASNHQYFTRPILYSRSMRIRDLSVAPLPLSCQSNVCRRGTMDIPLRRLVRRHHIHLSRWLINQTLFIPYTLDFSLARSDRLQFTTPHP